MGDPVGGMPHVCRYATQAEQSTQRPQHPQQAAALGALGGHRAGAHHPTQRGKASSSFAKQAFAESEPAISKQRGGSPVGSAFLLLQGGVPLSLRRALLRASRESLAG